MARSVIISKAPVASQNASFYQVSSISIFQRRTGFTVSKHFVVMIAQGVGSAHCKATEISVLIAQIAINPSNALLTMEKVEDGDSALR